MDSEITMFCLVRDENSALVGHQFMKYPKEDIYCLVWNDSFEIKSQEEMPILVSRKLPLKNSLQIELERTKDVAD